MTQSLALIFVTAPTEEAAAMWARTLVEEKLIACANLIPRIRSIYRWEGKVCDEAEVLMVLKAPAERFADIQKRVLELHHYEVPEVVMVKATDVNQVYWEWVRQSVHEASGASP